MSGNNEIEIKKFFEEIFKNMYGYYYEREYMETISNFPLRTVMQYLKAYSDSINKGQKTDFEIRKDFIQKNKDIFLNSLMRFGLDLEFFDIARGEKGIDLLTLKFLQKVFFEEVKDFKPYTSDQNKNITFILIPQYFNNYLEFSKYNEWGIKFLLPIFLKATIEKKEIDRAGNQKNKNIKENQKFLDYINQYCNIFEKPYKKLHILQPILVEENFLIVQTYKHKRGLTEAINSDKAPQNWFCIEDLKKDITEEIEKKGSLNLKSIYYSIPIIEVPFYEKGESLAYLSPLEIINFLFLLLEYKNDNDILKTFLNDKINAFLGEEKEIGIESLNDTQNESNNQNEEDTARNEFKILNDLISEWKKKLGENLYNMHLLEFNICFSNYLSYTYGNLKIKPDKSVLEYIQLALLNFVNEFTRNKLKEYGETSKRLASSAQSLFQNLRKLDKILEETKNSEGKEKLKNFRNFIYLILISPAFYPYYTEKFRKDLIQHKLYKELKIEEIYSEEKMKIMNSISENLEKLPQIKEK